MWIGAGARSYQCTWLGDRRLHADVARTSSPSIMSSAAGMASTGVHVICGSHMEARQSSIDTLSLRDVVSWNKMIMSCVQQGQNDKPLELYSQMQQQGVRPNSRTFVGLLKACSNMAISEESSIVGGQPVKQGCLRMGRHIHREVVKVGLGSDVYVATTLLNMYNSCGSTSEAWHVFNSLHRRDVVVWNAMMTSYVRQGNVVQALQLFDQMQKEGEKPSNRTFVCIIKACASLAVLEESSPVNGRWIKRKSLERGKKLHAQVLEMGMALDIFMGNTLVDMYAKCGDMTHAQQVFDEMVERNAVTWTVLITGYAQQKEGGGGTALHFYDEMLNQRVMPDSRTYVAVLKACCCLAATETDTFVDGEWVKLVSFEKGKKIHNEIVKRNLDNDVFVGNSLVTMYASCGSLRAAQRVFDALCNPDVVSWNAIIAGYLQQERGEKVLELYCEMQRDGIRADTWTFVSVLNACGCLEFGMMGEEEDVCSSGAAHTVINFSSLQRGKIVHEAVVAAGCQFDAFVGATLVNMYGNCRSMPDAQHVFDTLLERGVVSWTALISGYSQRAQGDVALDLFIQMREEGIIPTNRTFASALKACSALAALEEATWMNGKKTVKAKSLERGKAIYAEISRQPLEADLIVGNALIDMLASCGALADAQQVFDTLLSEPNVVTWTALIGGYADQGQEEKALQLYQTMLQEDPGVIPNNRTFVLLLKADGSLAAKETGNTLVNGGRQVIKARCLQMGQEIHAEVVRRGYSSDTFVGAALVDMYGNCGSLAQARYVFDNLLPHRDVVAWTTMLAAYAQNGQGEKAWGLYCEMVQEQGVKPNGRTFACALKACCSLAAAEEEEGRCCVASSVAGMSKKAAVALQKGREVHKDILKFGLDGDNTIVMAGLVQMYASCGDMVEAQRTFDNMVPPTRRDVTTWTALIAGYAQQKQGDKAMQWYARMKEQGVRPDIWTFVGALKACCSLAATDDDQVGKQQGYYDGSPSSCRLPVQQHGIEKAKQVHEEIVEAGFESDLFIGASLIHMYANFGCMEDACRVFEGMPERDVVVWTAMITGYAQNEEGAKALQLYVQMQAQQGLKANKRTFVSLLKACGSLAASEQAVVLVDDGGEAVKPECLHKGKQIHGQILESGGGGGGDGGSDSDLIVSTALVDMYAKCGSMVNAERVFNATTASSRDVVLWTAMLAGYADQGQADKAMHLYAEMRERGVVPTEATFLALLHACSSVGALETCRQIHEDVVTTTSGVLELSTRLVTCLVHAYGKCGSMVDAQRLFDDTPQAQHDVFSWTALLAGYARQGVTGKCLQCYESMQGAGVRPDGVTLLSVLAACSHAGLVQVGLDCFDAAQRREHHSINVTVEHYICLVDLLGRAGLFHRVEELVQQMPVQPTAALWCSVLGGCQKYGNVDLGRRAFECAVKLDPKSSAPYMLLGNIYARAQMWEDAVRVEELRRSAGAWKKPGVSWVEHADSVHSFLVGDTGHPQTPEIHANLHELRELLLVQQNRVSSGQVE